MPEIVDKDKCCGCHACMNICPKSAISMVEDEKGFKYPFIDEKKCINCNLCKKACPVLNNKSEINHNIKAYACYNKNINERLNSSSGGIFILLAKEIIKKNGIVFGAAFDDEFIIKHTYIDNEKQLVKFMGSKYAQSSIGETYKKTRELLNDNRTVLFSGTPCQIEGLLSFLGKRYDNLYTQDIICHGVPSPKVWKKYLEYQEKKNKENIKSVSFRNKDHSWSLFRMKISFDTKTYSKNLHEDIYMKAFLKNICLRESCYNCSFKKKYRLSDITLADYWGINNIHPDMNDDKGTSLLLINSKKGQELFDSINENIIYKETNIEDAIKSNKSLIKSAEHCINEKEFFDNLDSMDFDKLVSKYVPKAPMIKRLKRKIKNIIKKIIKK